MKMTKEQLAQMSTKELKSEYRDHRWQLKSNLDKNFPERIAMGFHDLNSTREWFEETMMIVEELATRGETKSSLAKTKSDIGR